MKIQSKRLNWVRRRASVAQGRARLEGAANPSILASQVAEDLGKVRRSGRMPTYRRVSSSGIHEVGYDASEQVLAIRFHNGREYLYADVPDAIYCSLLSAPSIGGYFNGEIRDAYSCQRIK